jgi:hypothetical protein
MWEASRVWLMIMVVLPSTCVPAALARPAIVPHIPRVAARQWT